MELITKQKEDHLDLLRSHVWGCPAYVLEPKLQNGQKLPKWNRRSRLGQFMGYSDEHSSLVANIRHLNTGYVSPQYHVVYDDLFQTVLSTGPNLCVRSFLQPAVRCMLQTNTTQRTIFFTAPHP